MVSNNKFTFKKRFQLILKVFSAIPFLNEKLIWTIGMSKSDAQSIGSAEVEIATPAEQVDGKDTASSNTMSPNHDE
jgi:hypothetical protein